MFTTKEESPAHTGSASKVLNQRPPDSLLINHKEKKYPFCIVWTKAPTITSFFPCFGHVGIAGYFFSMKRNSALAFSFLDLMVKSMIMLVTQWRLVKHLILLSCLSFFKSDHFAYDVPYKYVQLNLQNINFAEFDKALRVTDSKFHQTKVNMLFQRLSC